MSSTGRFQLQPSEKCNFFDTVISKAGTKRPLAQTDSDTAASACVLSMATNRHCGPDSRGLGLESSFPFAVAISMISSN